VTILSCTSNTAGAIAIVRKQVQAMVDGDYSGAKSDFQVDGGNGENNEV
jgi:hypothetical protein